MDSIYIIICINILEFKSMKTIIIKDIIGAEARSRKTAKLLLEKMNDGRDFILDMNGVKFISRSFADELYNIQEVVGKIMFINTSDEVGKMLAVVKTGRSQTRQRKESDTETCTLSDMDSLFRFFSGF